DSGVQTPNLTCIFPGHLPSLTRDDVPVEVTVSQRGHPPPHLPLSNPVLLQERGLGAIPALDILKRQPPPLPNAALARWNNHRHLDTLPPAPIADSQPA